MNKKKRFLRYAVILIFIAVVYFSVNYAVRYRIYKNISLLKSPYRETREKASKEIVKIGKPAVSPLIYALKFDFVYIKAGVTGGVKKVVNTKDVDSSLKKYQEEAKNLKIGAAYVLGEIKNPNAVIPVSGLLKDKNKKVRDEAVYALIKFGKISCKPVVKYLRDKNLDVRISALKVIAANGDEDNIDILVKVLSEGDFSSKEIAADALNRIGKPATGKVLKLLESKDHQVKTLAVVILGRNREKRAVDPLIRIMLNENEYSFLRADVSEALGRIGSYRAVNALIKTCDEGYDSLRTLLAEKALNKITEQGVVAELAKAVENPDYSRFQKCIAAKRLENINETHSIKPLIDLLDSNDSLLKVSVRKSLINMNCPGVFQELSKLMVSKNKTLRQEVIIILGRRLDQESADLCMNSLKDEDSLVRLTAVEALNNYNHKWIIIPYNKKNDGKDKKKYADLIKESFISVLNDESYTVRKQAVLALGRYRDKRTVSALIKVLKDKDYEVREAAMESLSLIGNPEAVPYVAKILDEDDINLRRKAVEALGGIHDKSCIPPLKRALKDKDPEVRILAKVSLVLNKNKKEDRNLHFYLYSQPPHIRRVTMVEMGKKEKGLSMDGVLERVKYSNTNFNSMAINSFEAPDDIKAVDRMIDCLDSRYYDENVEKFFLARKDKYTVQKLIKALKHKNRYTRGNAAKLLGKIGDKSAVEPLIKRLMYNDDFDNIEIMRALGKLKDKRALKPLMKEAKESYCDEIAVEALGDLRDKSVVPFLIEELKYSRWEEKEAIAYALGKIKDPRAIEPLIKSLDDYYSESYNASIWALKCIGKPAIPHLKKALASDNDKVREGAAEVLRYLEKR